MKITRSFSKKIQLKQYEPIEFFCGAESEVEKIEDIELTSRMLDKFCQDEVEKSLNKFRQIDTKKVEDVAKDEAELDINAESMEEIE